MRLFNRFVAFVAIFGCVYNLNTMVYAYSFDDWENYGCNVNTEFDDTCVCCSIVVDELLRIIEDEMYSGYPNMYAAKSPDFWESEEGIDLIDTFWNELFALAGTNSNVNVTKLNQLFRDDRAALIKYAGIVMGLKYESGGSLSNGIQIAPADAICQMAGNNFWCAYAYNDVSACAINDKDCVSATTWEDWDGNYVYRYIAEYKKGNTYYSFGTTQYGCTSGFYGQPTVSYLEGDYYPIVSGRKVCPVKENPVTGKSVAFSEEGSLYITECYLTPLPGEGLYHDTAGDFKIVGGNCFYTE